MKKVTHSKTKLRYLSYGFIYSRINYGSTEHDIIVLTNFSPSLNYDFLIKQGFLVIAKWERTTQNQIFQSKNLFQSNCIHRSNEQVKQVTCFNFPEMSWLLAEHEGQGLRLGAEDRRPYHKTAEWVPNKFNNLVFFSFAMVPMYIYLENLKIWLNTMRFALCLATESLLNKEIASWDCHWTCMLWQK